MNFNPFEFFRNGYHQGLLSAADFIKSGKTFEQWYGLEPDTLDTGWSEILKSLDREDEYINLRKKFEEYHEDRF